MVAFSPTKASIESIWNGKSTHISNLVDAKLVANPSGSFVDQAREMHSADIIIASHGAALTNLAFIRPCTAVLELFPFGYYIGFFQPLVLAGEGIPYDGYLSDGSRLAESSQRKGRYREVPLYTSPESVLRAFPKVLLEVMNCRENWRGEKNK